MDPTARYRLEDLVGLCERLAELLPEGESRRVRWQPNPRLVRYYNTLGLIDRPTEMRGRTAYYSQRHLLQLMAIKTLQAQGLSLEQVQARLAGSPDEALISTAGLPEDWSLRLEVPPPPPPATSRSERFWEQEPTVADDPAEPAPAPWAGFELAPGVLVMLDPKRAPLDPAALEAVTRKLTELLQDR